MIGKSHNVCVTTAGARDFPKSVITCTGSMLLRDGMMTWQGSLKAGADPVTGAVTGGTGAYANARGGFVSKDGQDATRSPW